MVEGSYVEVASLADGSKQSLCSTGAINGPIVYIFLTQYEQWVQMQRASVLDSG